MASSLLDYFGMPDDEEQMDYSSSLLGSPKRKSSGPDMGMLGLAAGLLEPTVNGRIGPAFANGLKGWAGGVAAQRKLDEADAENDPNALMQKYMTQAKIKAQIAKEYPEAEKWGMAPFVDSAGNVYQMGNNGSIRQLTDIHGRFTPPTTVDTGGSLRVINPSNPTQPLGEIPKSLNPLQALENRPNRFTQTQNPDGTTTQTDTNTGKQDVVTNPNAPKAPPAEYANTMGAMDDFNNKLDQYISLLENRSRVGSVLPGNDRLALDQAHGDLTMALKNVYQLGVLNKGDLPQIERQLMNPVSPGATLYSNEALVEQARKAKEAMNAKRDSLKNSYRDTGYKVDTPVTGQVKFGDQSGRLDYTDVDAAEKDLAAHPEWPQETRDQVRSAIDKAKGSSPYSVNKSSVPALKKPSADSLNAARAKINEYANDPNAQANVREQIIKRLQENGYDTTGL